ncbi:DUF2892 domain-containing protein [Variovorax sp. LjRoot84]|uniref:YgaP family membrane protein n=1 Tax=Variovorax sp. LjRoot84 TaxID=3342340 RepID=UPI003ECDE3B9
MKRNVGAADRLLRITAGAALIGLSAAGTIGPWGYLGIVPLLTGLSGACPAYALLGVSTCASDSPRGRPGRP